MLVGNKLSIDENLYVTVGAFKRIHTFTADISLPADVFKIAWTCLFK